MSGRWRIDPAELDKHDHLLLETDDGRRLALNDPRRFGSLDLVRTDDLGEWPAIRCARARSRSSSIRADLKKRLRGRSAAIKLLLLDQRIVAGLGNIYVCEALYRARINPAARRAARSRSSGSSGWCRRSRRCSPKRSRRAARALRDFASPDGELGYFSKSFAVYDREGRAVRLRRRGEAHRPGWPLDFLLPALPALTQTEGSRRVA